MLRVRNVLIDLHLLTAKFVCDLNACKGACCEEGDLGAPLLHEEVQQLNQELPAILPYLDSGGRETIAQKGCCEPTEDGEWVTQTVRGRACVFAVQQNGCWNCGIERAFNDGATGLPKPMSCHLYPIRVEKVGSLDALHYHQWSICAPACDCGLAMKVPVYQFLKSALVRRYGADWYTELEATAEAYLGQRSKS